MIGCPGFISRLGNSFLFLHVVYGDGYMAVILTIGSALNVITSPSPYLSRTQKTITSPDNLLTSVGRGKPSEAVAKAVESGWELRSLNLWLQKGRRHDYLRTEDVLYNFLVK